MKIKRAQQHYIQRSIVSTVKREIKRTEERRDMIENTRRKSIEPNLKEISGKQMKTENIENPVKKTTTKIFKENYRKNNSLIC